MEQQMPKVVSDILELRMPLRCNLAELMACQIAMQGLWNYMDWQRERFPKLFKKHPDTARKRKKREETEKVIFGFIEQRIDPDKLLEIPEYRQALRKRNKNMPKELPGAIVRVLAYTAALVLSAKNSKYGWLYYIWYGPRVRWELEILKKNLREYFQEGVSNVR